MLWKTVRVVISFPLSSFPLYPFFVSVLPDGRPSSKTSASKAALLLLLLIVKNNNSIDSKFQIKQQQRRRRRHQRNHQFNTPWHPPYHRPWIAIKPPPPMLPHHRGIKYPQNSFIESLNSPPPLRKNPFKRSPNGSCFTFPIIPWQFKTRSVTL